MKYKILIVFGIVMAIVTVISYRVVDMNYCVSSHVCLGGGIKKHCLKDNPQKCFCTDAHQKVVACPI